MAIDLKKHNNQMAQQAKAKENKPQPSNKETK
jgi:hypothetical protein